MSAVRLERRSSAWVFVVALAGLGVLAGCSASDSPHEEPHGSDGGTRPGDGGTQDAGTGSNDGGTQDGGTQPTDGGTQSPDAGSPSFTWGQGTDTGTLAGDVWTPGRDGTGLVNQVSWAIVPKGRWVEVSGTPITQLEAELKAAIPGYRDLGSQGLSGVINAFSGIALDVPNARWWAFGGGHNDSSNNGLYRFDMSSMRWSIEKLPDNPANWPSDAYGNTLSVYLPAADYIRKNPDSDVYPDEFFDADRPAASTRNPVARHTYNGLVYNPDLNEVAFGVRRMWRYSLDTRTWKRHNPFDTPGSKYDGATGYGGAAGWTFWDEVKRQYLFGPTENYNYSQWWSFDIDDQTWKWEVITPPAWAFAQMVKVKRKLVSFPLPGGADRHTFPPQLIAYNLDTTQWEFYPLDHGLELARCFKGDFEGQIMAYVAPLNRYIAAFRYDKDGDGTFEYRTYVIDATASTLREAPEYEVGAFGGWHDLVKNRFFYLATHDALVLVRKGEENLRVFKLP